MRQAMPHQVKGLKYAKKTSHPAFLMDMRLGKTMTAIRWVASIGATLVLVAAPKTVFEAWERELTLEGEPFLLISNLSRKSREEVLVAEGLESGHRVWVILNYELMQRIEGLNEIPWDVVILDESTKIKNPGAQITKFCVRGFRDVEHRAILSGLPAPESELELFCQFQFLHGKFMGCDNYWTFRNRYFQPSVTGFDWEPKKGSRQAIKEALHTKAYVVRRSQVMSSKKIFEQRRVDMTPKQKRLYRDILRDFAFKTEDGRWVETQWAMTASGWLQRLAGGFDPEGTEVLNESKAHEILALARGDLSSDQFPVWFKYRAELELVKRVLEKAKIETVVVHGDVKPAERSDAIRKFRAKQAQVFLATEKTAKMGVDLSTADTAIYYSNEWSCEDRLQSEDRIVNAFKTSPPLFIDLVTRGSVDEEAVASIRDKSFNARELMIKHTLRGLNAS